MPVDDVASLRLHPGFAEQWLSLRAVLMPLTVIVDVANVMGSRPDGWWKDRAGAAGRLAGQIAGLAGRGVTSLPESVPVPAIERWFPQFVLVLEGAPRPRLTQSLPSLGCEWSGPPGQGTTRSLGWRPRRSGSGWS